MLSASSVELELPWKQIDAVCARPVVAVGIGIHHIAAHLDRVTAANIEIKSYGIVWY